MLNYIDNDIHFEGVKFELYFYDAWKKYPQFIGTEYESMLFQQWQINIENMTHVQRYELLKKLQNGGLNVESDDKIGKLSFHIYSES